MQNYLGDGQMVIIASAPAPVVSGQGLLVGAMFVICAASAAEGQPVQGWLTGMYQLPKNSADVWTLGQLIYWDNTAMLATSTAGGNTKIGVATASAANPSSVGNVRLNGAF
jgi:predicted RecA/RadA family phage recombinase